MRPLAKYRQKRPHGVFCNSGFSEGGVELSHHLVNVLVGYVLKTAAFGIVLPDQAIGVFVQAALARAVRVRKVNVRSQRRLDFFMPGKPFAVVCGDGQGLVQIRP
jgi:hypothetical protein